MATQKKIRQRVEKMKSSLKTFEADIKWFVSVQGWLPLGYEGLAEFWDAEFRDIPIATGLRNWVIVQMYEDAPHARSGRLFPGSKSFIADTMGVSTRTVGHVVTTTRARHRPRVTGYEDYKNVTLGFGVPNLWRRHVINTALEKQVNMADILRPMIKDGMQQRYGVDVDAPIKPARAARR